MNNERIVFLIGRYQRSELTPSEEQELDQLIQNDPEGRQIKPALQAMLELSAPADSFNTAHWEKLSYRILETDKNGLTETYPVVAAHRIHFLKTTWFRYAAAVIFILASGAYLWFQNDRKQTLTVSKQLSADIKPGRQGAVLTLADGSQLVLDSLKDGVIAEQNGSKVLLKDGSMSYNAGGEYGSGMVHNTLSTPNGRQFQFFLPDGSRVWLNAASSIRYPTVFSGKNRTVQVTGEAYFDISPKANKPFIVETNDMTLEVLGTEFNINSYDNEAYSQTTLVNGLVKLKSNRNSAYKLLYPGKQASISRKGTSSDSIIIADAPNIDQVIAWKDGLFNFNKVDLFSLMRQLERWYNIEVEYSGDVENIKFRGKMYRNINLSDVLKELRKMDLSIEQKGNKLIVKSIK